MVNRGTIYYDNLYTTLSIQNETTSLVAGVSNLAVPFTPSNLNFAGAIKGRIRLITLQGQYAGTQLQIEAFITVIEHWMNNGLGLSNGGLYYPLHHKNRDDTGFVTTPNTPGQQAYPYKVFIQDFVYKYDVSEPTRITYTMTLMEGSLLGTWSNIPGNM